MRKINNKYYLIRKKAYELISKMEIDLSISVEEMKQQAISIVNEAIKNY